MNTFDPLYKVHNAYRLGQIPQKVYDLVMKRFPLVIEGIKRVEEASGLNYPYYYAEPNLVISTSAVEFTEIGTLCKDDTSSRRPQATTCGCADNRAPYFLWPQGHNTCDFGA